MISVKYASIIAVAAFAAGSIFASPVPQAIAVVIATDVQCTGCVGTSDLAGNAVTAAKIKDGEVNAAEIATDAVGAAEIVGVTKLLFANCNPDSSAGNGGSEGTNVLIPCNITGVDSSDQAIATIKGQNNLCFAVASATPATGKVIVGVVNVCDPENLWKTGDKISIIVYDK